jgi:hypothetical protein
MHWMAASGLCRPANPIAEDVLPSNEGATQQIRGRLDPGDSAAK